MKIAITSDVHLEFGDLDLTNDENADVLILGGDIFIATELKGFTRDESGLVITATQSVRARAERYVDFVTRCAERFKHVILIMGNHEHYHGDYAESANLIRGTFGDLHNVHFLDKEWRIINGILFFGGTLLEDHFAFRRGLDSVLELHPNMPTVVVGHHAPSKASTHPRYKNETLMNGAYSTNLDDYILDRRQIKLWTHAHTHEDFDYMIGTTRIVCNPRGYINYEAKADDFKLKYVEV